MYIYFIFIGDHNENVTHAWKERVNWNLYLDEICNFIRIDVADLFRFDDSRKFVSNLQLFHQSSNERNILINVSTNYNRKLKKGGNQTWLQKFPNDIYQPLILKDYNKCSVKHDITGWNRTNELAVCCACPSRFIAGLRNKRETLPRLPLPFSLSLSLSVKRKRKNKKEKRRKETKQGDKKREWKTAETGKQIR